MTTEREEERPRGDQQAPITFILLLLASLFIFMGFAALFFASRSSRYGPPGVAGADERNDERNEFG